MEALDFVATLFNVTLTQASRGSFNVSRKIELGEIRTAIINGKLQWQDPDAIDCGNNDGVVYFMLSDDEETMLAYNYAEDELYIS